jgi:hypothetical protein
LYYYTTQFKVVFLSSATARLVSPQDWLNWLNDTLEDFVFIVEEAPGLQVPMSGRVQVASPAWLTEHVWWLDDDPDLRALAKRIAEHAATGVALFAISRSGDLEALRKVEALREVMGY